MGEVYGSEDLGSSQDSARSELSEPLDRGTLNRHADLEDHGP